MVASRGHPGQVSSPRRWKSSAVAGAIALVLLGVSALGIAVSLASRASVWVKNDSSESVAFFVTDLSDFAVMNEVYGEFFGSHRPARSTVQVAALPGGAKVEMEAWAYVPHR